MRWEIRLVVILTVSVAHTCCYTPTYAKKADNPGGGGNHSGSGLELVDLQPVEATFSDALAINDAGIIAGMVDGVAGTWNATAEIIVFTPLLGGTSGGATDINNANTAVGWHGAPGNVVPRYWPDLTSDPIDLPLPAGFSEGWANSVSLDGVVVGELRDSQNFSAAAVWRVSDGLVFGPTVVSTDAIAYDVASLNDGSNRVVGEAFDPDLDRSTAMAWDVNLHPNGAFTITDSESLFSSKTWRALAVTELGDVTGLAVGGRAFVMRDGELALLPSSGRNKYGEGRDLNNSDVVGATGLSSSLSTLNATRWNSRNRSEALSDDYFDTGVVRHHCPGCQQ